MHTHACTEIFYVVGGSGKFNIEGKLLPVTTDDMVIVNPNVEHTEVSYNQRPLEYIVLGVEGLEYSAGEDADERWFMTNLQNAREALLHALREMLREMEPGTVMVDVAIDQGGCFETSRPTTHEDPVYYVDGILHYCVANIPGAVPRTSTLALTNATLPYTIQLADKGWRRAAQENPELALGLNIIGGRVVCKPVADAWGLPYEPLAL